MNKGPLFNNKKQNLSKRNSLGIEGIATTMSDSLCPVITLVTPRPFYWILKCWCYYDLFENSGKTSSVNDNEVNKYYKRINYFLRLGNTLAGNIEDGGFVGSIFVNNLVYANPDKQTFDYENGYIKTMTQLNYYNNALTLLKLIKEGESENGAQRIYMYESGKELAESFDLKMKTTSFYEYRFKEAGIPREVLVDLGKKIRIDLSGFDESKRIMSRILFENKLSNIIYKMEDNKNYIRFISNDSDLDMNNEANNRYLLFEHYPSRGMNQPIPNDLKQISIGWEIIVGRQYYSYGLGIIWKYLLSVLNSPLTINKWIGRAISSSHFSFSVKDKLETIKDSFQYNYEEYEKICSEERRESSEKSVENGLKVILAMYDRFKDRDDYPDRYSSMFERDVESTSSLRLLEEEIDKYSDKPIEDYLVHVMKSQLIYQHLMTAFNKLPDHDGYYVIENDGRYIKVEDYDLNFTGLRSSRVYSVIKDLGLV